MFTHTQLELFIATLAFAGGHFAISSTPLRASLVRRLGEKRYLGLFSVFMGLAMAWMILSYSNAPQTTLWPQTPWARHLPLVIMPVALILVVAGLRPDNPTMVGASANRLRPDHLGPFAITRHPFLWGAALWALAHLPANGDMAALTLMGGILVLALGGTVAIDAKTRRDRPEDWQRLAALTSNIPFAAVISRRARFTWRDLGWTAPIGGLLAYAALLWLHPYLFGVSPLP